MRTIGLVIIQCTVLLSLMSCTEKHSIVWIDDLKLENFSEGIRPVKSKTNYKTNPISIGDIRYERGFGSITTSVFTFLVDGNAKRFIAEVGMDDEARKGTPIQFYVIGDRKTLFESGDMEAGDPAKKVDVDLSGIKRVGLLTTDHIGGVKNNATYCNWANARFIMTGSHLPTQIPNSGEKYILTPVSRETPRINSANVFGATPGNPFLYTIAATGKRPMHFFAENLPDGLVLDSQKGIISGKINQKGTCQTTLKVTNELGEATKILTIKIGDTIALTPPMGWNGWNSWAHRIDREKVIASADAMVEKGLRDHGWTYVNIDDTWQGTRGGRLNSLQANEKFPDIGEMVDYIHSLGLKAGIYSTPYISSYGGYVGASSEFPTGGETHDLIRQNRQAYMHIGKYRFEINDALQMGEWGFDYLKYDWRIDVNSAERMSSALKKSGRDIVFSISNNAPIEKAADWAGVTNAWRTGPDIRDSWTSLYFLSFTIDKWAEFAGPGHWNDPDMMVLGNVSTGTDIHPSRLTPDEQYAHVSIFSLLAVPMLIGCPIEELDDFTLNLLTNDEVIEINQDPLGKPARLLAEENGIQIWMKPMEDGSFTTGLFNTGDFGKTPQSFFRWGDETAKQFVFDFARVGLSGKWRLRNVWRQQDLGVFENSFSAEIPHHGVVLLRFYPGKNKEKKSS